MPTSIPISFSKYWPELALFVVAIVTAIPPASLANPIPFDYVLPPHTMIGENVLVGIAENGAVVSGHYRFHVTPDATEHGWPPYRLTIQLPVPVPVDWKKYDHIKAAVHPILKIKGENYEPTEELVYYEVPSLPAASLLATFIFTVQREDLSDEFDVDIQYEQPVIKVADKDMVYYVPFLPTYERYAKSMGLRPESYKITFTSIGDAYIRLLSPVTKLEQSEPKLISVEARHKETIAVERIVLHSDKKTGETLRPLGK